MLGQEIRTIRKRRGLSLREVARLAQLSAEAVSGIERGERYPTLRTLEALAEALNMAVIIGPHETVVEDCSGR